MGSQISATKSTQIKTKFFIMFLQKSTTIFIAIILTVLIQSCLSLPEDSAKSCSSSTCKNCLDTCNSCDQCGLCTLCLGSTIGPCSQCQFCKGGAAGCKRLCKKAKITPFAKPASQIVLDVSRAALLK